MATSTRTRRPAREQTAYDAGREGGPMPAWVEESPKLIAAWEDGAADRENTDLAAAQADPIAAPTRRPRPPAPRDASTASTGDATVSGQARDAVDWGASGRWLRTRPGVSDASGFLLGLLGFALFQAYLRGGWAGVRGWLGAKFLNRPSNIGGAATPLTPASPDGVVVPFDATPTPGQLAFRARERGFATVPSSTTVGA